MEAASLTCAAALFAAMRADAFRSADSARNARASLRFSEMRLAMVLDWFEGGVEMVGDVLDFFAAEQVGSTDGDGPA